jgi:F420-dependent oxidoreductase-like protein
VRRSERAEAQNAAPMPAATPPRIGVTIPYTDVAPREQTVEFVQAADRLGYESVWVPEAYGYDAITFLSLLACRTERIQLATGIINVFSRTPALIGQTIAGLDDISGGRAILGLGTSGPQVVEGWHGMRFEKGVQRTREVVEIVRMVLRRERVVYEGKVFNVPKGLKLITHPRRAGIDIALATLTDAGVALTAELADRWMPTLFDPGKAPQVFAEALARGKARRDPGLRPLQVCPTVPVYLGDPAEARAALKPYLALYIGGMGSRERNFYNALVSRYGYAEEARRIQELYLGGEKQQAIALVPDQLVDEICVAGDEDTCRRRVAALLDNGVDVPLLNFANLDAETRLRALEAVAPAHLSELSATLS